MGTFLLYRTLQAFVTLAVVSIIIFLGVFALGNPVYVLVDPSAPADVVEQTIRRLGLDRPIYEQYGIFVTNALSGDLGTSYTHAQPSLALIASRFTATFELVLASLVIAVALGLPLGLIAGYGKNNWVGRTLSSVSILGISVPIFWLGLLMIIVFSLELKWLPTGGRGETVALFGVETSLLTLDGLSHLVLPAMALSLFPLALIIRLTRAGVREHSQMDYVRFARAMGIRPAKLLFAYVLRNVLIPIVTMIGLIFGTLIAFAVVTETVFAWPGIGKLLIDSIKVSDRPVIIAYLLFVVVMFLVINLIVDVINAALDPRIRLSGTS
ncbi:MAG: ABC transporter permease subunit [Alphaproteobacteria bacterium]|nr:ABC transporter permease subunit [Alphaproteobacteria bacterium]